MGNGADTSFWGDVWRGDDAFKSFYPRIYALETCKNVTVAVKMSHENVGFSLRRIPRGEGSREFMVASVRRLIDECWLSEVSTKTRWINVVPIKVNVHAWKVRLDCLPTRLDIFRRCMNIDSILCPICDEVVEYASHIFFACHIAREVFHKITSWWDVNFMEVSSYEEWLEWIRLHTKKLLEGVAILCGGLSGIFATRVFSVRIFLRRRIFLRILCPVLSIGVDIYGRLLLVGLIGLKTLIF
ncbi:RNA-directed DNA polymerase, eukaryota, reverse transcriptase zinc-binding domain protein [Tanacetum coccineum]